MKILLLILCIFINLTFANDVPTDENSTKVDYSQYFDSEEETVGKDSKEYFEEIYTSNENSQLIYATITSVPKKVFKNQRFYIDISATIATDNFDSVKTRFLNMKNIHILNADSKWTLEKDNVFVNRFYFKVDNAKFQMPTFQIGLEKENIMVDSAKLETPPIEFVSVAKEDKEFANLVADEIILKSSKAKQYNNKQLLVILELDGKNSNLEDFRIKELQTEQGMLTFDDKGAIQKAFYYFISPVYQKSIMFKYFNNKQNKFIEINVPITLEQDLVSTQTDLNPYDSDFLFYKKIAIGVLLGLFIMLYFFKRKSFILVIILSLGIYFIILMMPNKFAILKENSDIRIIPTINSTVFYKPAKPLKIELLQKQGEFVKVIFENRDTKKDNIGWVKESEIVKN